MRLAVVLMIILIAPLAYATDAEINAYIDGDLSVRNTITYHFSSLPDSSITYNLPAQTIGISVLADGNPANYDITANTLIIHAANSTLLTIDYTAADVVFRSDSAYNFFTEFDFEETINNLNVTISLPEGYVIHNDFFRPDDGAVSTDGRRIILSWNETSASGKRLFAVIFSRPGEGGNLLVFFLVVLSLAAIAGFVHFRIKMRESFMKGFREDEKRTIEFLRLKKTAMQSDLQKQFGFSRAKATRIVMVLEHKGLVRKERYGRTNRLHWLSR